MGKGTGGSRKAPSPCKSSIPREARSRCQNRSSNRCATSSEHGERQVATFDGARMIQFPCARGMTTPSARPFVTAWDLNAWRARGVSRHDRREAFGRTTGIDGGGASEATYLVRIAPVGQARANRGFDLASADTEDRASEGTDQRAGSRGRTTARVRPPGRPKRAACADHTKPALRTALPPLAAAATRLPAPRGRAPFRGGRPQKTRLTRRLRRGHGELNAVVRGVQRHRASVGENRPPVFSDLARMSSRIAAGALVSWGVTPYFVGRRRPFLARQGTLRAGRAKRNRSSKLPCHAQGLSTSHLPMPRLRLWC